MKLPGSKIKHIALFAILISLLKISRVCSQDLEPRAYTNIPVGINFVVAGYAYSAGSVLFDPAVPLENANIKIHGTVMAYASSIKVGQMSGKFLAIDTLRTFLMYINGLLLNSLSRLQGNCLKKSGRKERQPNFHRQLILCKPVAGSDKDPEIPGKMLPADKCRS